MPIDGNAKTVTVQAKYINNCLGNYYEYRNIREKREERAKKKKKVLSSWAPGPDASFISLVNRSRPKARVQAEPHRAQLLALPTPIRRESYAMYIAGCKSSTNRLR